MQGQYGGHGGGMGGPGAGFGGPGGAGGGNRQIYVSNVCPLATDLRPLWSVQKADMLFPTAALYGGMARSQGSFPPSWCVFSRRVAHNV